MRAEITIGLVVGDTLLTHVDFRQIDLFRLDQAVDTGTLAALDQFCLRSIWVQLLERIRQTSLLPGIMSVWIVLILILVVNSFHSQVDVFLGCWILLRVQSIKFAIDEVSGTLD
jgi:hypothetical protein